MLLVLLWLRFALLRPANLPLSVDSQIKSRDLQYRNAWLNQCALLKTCKAIAKQVSFGLLNAASKKRNVSLPVADLEIPEVLAQILADLHLDIVFRDSVLSESLASEAFL